MDQFRSRTSSTILWLWTGLHRTSLMTPSRNDLPSSSATTHEMTELDRWALFSRRMWKSGTVSWNCQWSRSTSIPLRDLGSQHAFPMRRTGRRYIRARDFPLSTYYERWAYTGRTVCYGFGTLVHPVGNRSKVGEKDREGISFMSFAFVATSWAPSCT